MKQTNAKCQKQRYGTGRENRHLKPVRIMLLSALGGYRG